MSPRIQLVRDPEPVRGSSAPRISARTVAIGAALGIAVGLALAALGVL